MRKLGDLPGTRHVGVGGGWGVGVGGGWGGWGVWVGCVWVGVVTILVPGHVVLVARSLKESHFSGQYLLEFTLKFTENIQFGGRNKIFLLFCFCHFGLISAPWWQKNGLNWWFMAPLQNNTWFV